MAVALACQSRPSRRLDVKRTPSLSVQLPQGPTAPRRQAVPRAFRKLHQAPDTLSRQARATLACFSAAPRHLGPTWPHLPKPPPAPRAPSLPPSPTSAALSVVLGFRPPPVQPFSELGLRATPDELHPMTGTPQRWASLFCKSHRALLWVLAPELWASSASLLVHTTFPGLECSSSHWTPRKAPTLDLSSLTLSQCAWPLSP